MGWFRWHDGTSEDAKWRCISEDTGISVATVTGVWAALLEGANNDTKPGIALRPVDEMAKILRVTVTDMHKVIDSMVRYRCIERLPDGIKITNWQRRQFSDSAAAIRMRRYRDRRRSGNVAGRPPRRVTAGVTRGDIITETDSDSDSDSEQNRTERDARAGKPPLTLANGHYQDAPKRSRRKGNEAPIAEHWEPRPEEYAYGAERALSRFDVMREAERFANHARQNDRRCVDWNAAFRNWLLKAVEHRTAQHATQPKTAGREGILP